MGKLTYPCPEQGLHTMSSFHGRSHYSATLTFKRTKGWLRNRVTEANIKLKTHLFWTNHHWSVTLKQTAKHQVVISDHHTCSSKEISLKSYQHQKLHKTGRCFRWFTHHHMQLYWTSWRLNTPPTQSKPRLLPQQEGKQSRPRVIQTLCTSD